MTTEEIYHAAVMMFKKACTAYMNFDNGDPETGVEDVITIVRRAQKAYAWCKENGKGNSCEYAASNWSRKGWGGETVQKHEVYKAVINNEGWMKA